MCLVNRRGAIIVANVTSLVPYERLQAPVQNGDLFLELAHASQMRFEMGLCRFGVLCVLAVSEAEEC